LAASQSGFLPIFTIFSAEHDEKKITESKKGGYFWVKKRNFLKK
jgi:hypothetical protein